MRILLAITYLSTLIHSDGADMTRTRDPRRDRSALDTISAGFFWVAYVSHMSRSQDAFTPSMQQSTKTLASPTDTSTQSFESHFFIESNRAKKG